MTVRWRAESSEYRLRKLVAENGDFETSVVVSDVWLPCGTNLVVRLPESAPRGEAYEADGVRYRAGGVGYEFTGEASWPYALAFGDFRLDTGYDFTFSYYPETDCTYSDTIPDYWFSSYLMDAYDYGEEEVYADDADPDGDGFTNRAEYLANTDPLDSADCLRITAVSPEGLSYRGGRDRTVLRERATSLAAPAWQVEPMDAPLRAGCFYRLRIPGL